MSLRREVIFEHVSVGGHARVAAVDVETGLEAVIVGPAQAARADLEALALRKLERLLERDASSPAPVQGPGKLV